MTAPVLAKQVPFDVFRDFAHISILYQTFQALAVHPSIPARTTQELVELLKRNPGKFSYPSNGVGSVFHLWGELFQQLAGVRIPHVPYKGMAPAFQDVLAGRVELNFFSYNQLIPFGDKLRILGILDSKRYDGAPELPAVGEVIPGFQMMPSWISLSAPAGVPRPIVMRLQGSAAKAINAADIRTELVKGGAKIIASTPEEMVAAMKADIALTARVVKSAGIPPQ